MQMNPIIKKDIKIKMRGWKAPALVTTYLAFLGLIILLVFLDEMHSPYNYFNPRVMTNVFNVLASFQFGLIIVITPALTAGAISGERERKTLDLLLCTDYSTFKIIIGKVIVSIAHVLLLIAASLPLLSTVFLFGGIDLADIFQLFAFYVITALMIASTGIFYSTIFKRSSVSMIVTYLHVCFLLFGTLVAYGVYILIVRRITGQVPADVSLWFMFANPLYGFSSIFGGVSGGLLDLFFVYGSYYGTTFSNQLKPWLVNVIFDIIVSAIFIIISSWKVKPVKRFAIIATKQKSKSDLPIGENNEG